MQSVQASDPGQGAQQRRVGSALGVKGRCHQALDKGPPWLGSCLHRAAQQRFSYTLCPAPGSPCLCAHSRDCLQCLSSLPCHFSPVQPRAPILSFRIYLEHLLLQSLPRCLAGCRDPPSPCSQMAPACTHTRAQTPLLTALPSLQCSCVFMSTSAARLLSLLRARPVSCSTAHHPVVPQCVSVKLVQRGVSLMVQWLGLNVPNTGGPGFNPWSGN